MTEPIGRGTAITVGIEHFEVKIECFGHFSAKVPRFEKLSRHTFINNPDVQVVFEHVLDNLTTAGSSSHAATIEQRDGTLSLHGGLLDEVGKIRLQCIFC